jgi:hypothetical protein
VSATPGHKIFWELLDDIHGPSPLEGSDRVIITGEGPGWLLDAVAASYVMHPATAVMAVIHYSKEAGYVVYLPEEPLPDILVEGISVAQLAG